MKYMIEHLDPELWKKFKLLCTMEGMTMRQKLEQMIRDEVERAKRKYSSERR